MSSNEKTAWKDRQRNYALDLVHYQVYKEGPQFKKQNTKRVQQETELSLSQIYQMLNHRKKARIEFPTIHAIFSSYDPDADKVLMHDKRNLWAVKRCPENFTIVPSLNSIQPLTVSEREELEMLRAERQGAAANAKPAAPKHPAYLTILKDRP